MEQNPNLNQSSQLDKLKNKKFLAAVVVFLILIVVGAALFFVRSQNSSNTSPSQKMIETSDLPKLNPEDIGMVVTVRKDNKALMFELTKASDITHVEYTIEYEKEIDGETVPEGIFGEMNIAEDGITKTDFREFGTCSAGRCRYDNVVSDIKITLKVTKNDGKDYEVVKTVKL